MEGQHFGDTLCSEIANERNNMRQMNVCVFVHCGCLMCVLLIVLCSSFFRGAVVAWCLWVCVVGCVVVLFVFVCWCVIWLVVVCLCSL